MVRDSCEAPQVNWVFSGFWLCGVEIVPAPPTAVAMWRQTWGYDRQNQEDSIFVDVGSLLILWAYPALFYVYAGSAFQLSNDRICPCGTRRSDISACSDTERQGATPDLIA